jgi:hypothetical protein
LSNLLGKLLNCLACQKVPPCGGNIRWGYDLWGI